MNDYEEIKKVDHTESERALYQRLRQHTNVLVCKSPNVTIQKGSEKLVLPLELFSGPICYSDTEAVARLVDGFDDYIAKAEVNIVAVGQVFSRGTTFNNRNAFIAHIPFAYD